MLRFLDDTLLEIQKRSEKVIEDGVLKLLKNSQSDYTVKRVKIENLEVDKMNFENGLWTIEYIVAMKIVMDIEHDGEELKDHEGELDGVAVVKYDLLNLDVYLNFDIDNFII